MPGVRCDVGARLARHVYCFLVMDTLTDEEYERCVASKNELEWNAACDAVKRARGGRYPHDWFSRMNQSGLATLPTFGCNRWARKP